MSNLQTKQNLLQQTVRLETEQRLQEEQEQSELREAEQLKEKNEKEAQRKVDEEMKLTMEESRRKSLLHDVMNDPKVPRSVVLLMQDQTSTLGNVRRHWRGTHDLVKENHYHHKDHKEDCSTMLSLLRELKHEIKTSFFHLKMETLDVGSYFPANTNDDIQKFMCQNTEFQMRRRGFHELLKTVVADTKKRFCDSLLNTLFTLKYKQTMRWPCIG